MKNIGASVSAVLTQGKKAEEKEEGEEKKYIRKENEVIFCLEEAPEYQISAVARWGENARGDVVLEVDTYFLHVLTGQRCESAWSCLTGWSEPDEKSMDLWETLCGRIEEYENIEQDMCYEKTIGV